MKTSSLFILLIVTFFGMACAKKGTVKKEAGNQLPKLVTIDFDKIDAEKKKQNNHKKEKDTLSNSSFNSVQKVQTKDTAIWSIFYGSSFKRMLYGKVKSSEELMYYTERGANGNIKKSNQRYYKKGIAFPWNFKVEFDTLGKLIRETGFSFRTKVNNVQYVGTEYFYNDKNQLFKLKNFYIDRGRVIYLAGNKITYNDNHKEKYRLIENYDSNIWISDSLVFKYNSKGDLENSKRYHRDEQNEKLVLENDFGEPVIFKYDTQGRVIDSNEKGGFHQTYEYKNGKLYKRELTYGGTDVYIYYPTGLIKSAKLRTTASRGDYKFNETGQPEFLNEKRIAEFKDYDKYGNWTTRISYKENGQPETYTNRVITYYE